MDLRFVSAYQGALACAEAFLYCCGYQAQRDNYHYMTWDALKSIDDEYIKSVISLFDDARKKRAKAFYDRAEVVGDEEFREILDETRKFIEYIKNKIKKDFPNFSKKI